MMSAPTVKPPGLPSGGGGQSSPKVGAPSTVNSPPASAGAGSPSKPLGGLGLPNAAGPPATVSPPGINHAPAPAASMPLPLSLVQEHKTANQQPPPRPAPVEKKEFPFSPSPAAKPTSNGVEGSPTKLSPVVPHIPPPEVKKAEEDSPALIVPNHSAEPATPVAPQPTQQQPPATTTVPPSPVTPVAPTAPTPTPPPAKQETPKTETPPKPEVAPTPTPAPAKAAQPEPPTAVPAPDPAPQPQTPAVETPARQPTETPVKTRTEAAPKPEFKVATPPRNSKRKKEVKPSPLSEPKAGSAGGDEDDERKPKRVRTRTQPYQSPIPELTYMAKLKTLMKSPDDKLIVFYKNEFLAVRNSEGSFYVCQAMQNIYKSSLRIRIRWLSQEKKDNKTTDVYIPDFYDATDFDCILTNLELKKLDKNKYQLPVVERERTQNILKRALDVEKGVSEKSPVTEEHPDGLDLSLYRDESQLKKRKSLKRGGTKRTAKKEKEAESEEDSDEDESDESSNESNEEDEAKKPVKLNIKRVEKPKTPAKPPPKEPEKRADQTSEREKRGATSKRRSEPVLAAVPEKKAKVPAATSRPAKKPEPTPPTRSAKTRSVRAAAPAQSLPPTRTKEREVRKAATPTKGRKKSAAKKA